MAKYIFPAVFSEDKEGGYSIVFPDIDGCFTSGDDLNDALSMAEDALAVMLVHMEDEHIDIPDPSPINGIKIHDGEFTTLICSDTIKYRHTLKNYAIKKTLSIPAWLNDAATAAGINFSQTLQDALKAKLNLL